ncbi:MAG TPA: trypsin-like peptidase domain-containing protein [Candidatus Dormibacteraeota bacterium]
MIEPEGAESHPSAPAVLRTSRRPFTPGALVASTLVAAIVSGAVAAGVTLGVLHLQARTNPQEVNLGSNVTVTEDSAAQQVATKALPAVVSVVTDENGRSFGSGFLITSDGYIVTSVGVVANSGTLTVVLPGDSHRRDARIVDFDCQTGMAVLKVEQVSGLPTLLFGDSSQLKVGQTVVALGGPFGNGSVFAKGAVNALHRTQSVAGTVPRGSGFYSDAIETDAAIDSGSSGGPLVNLGGQVVGLAVASGAASTPAFAISSNSVQTEVEQVVTTGQLVVADLGVESTDLSQEDAAIRGLPAGSLVTAVTSGSPSEASGLKVGDVITQLDDNVVNAAHPLDQVLRVHYRPAQRPTVTYVRGGSTNQVEVTLQGGHPLCA